MLISTKVSILLISYNCSKLIGKVIDSVLDQTFKDFELLILDNGSSDNSVDFIKKFNDPRIKLFEEKKNLGPEGSWNYVFNQSQGEYIRIFCSDDIMEKDCLQKQVSILEKKEDVDFVFTDIQVMNSDFEIIPDHQQLINIRKDRFEYLRYAFYEGNPFLTPTFMVRREALKWGYIMEERRSYFGDYTTWIKLMINGSEPHVIKECLVYSIKGEHNITSFDNKQKVNNFSFALSHYLEVFCNIQSLEELKKIFPESDKYTSKMNEKDVDLIPFVIAKLACDTVLVKQFDRFLSNSHVIFSLNKIHEILGDRVLAKKIDTLFDFNYFDFVKMTGEFDLKNSQKEESLELLNDIVASKSLKLFSRFLFRRLYHKVLKIHKILSY